MSEVKKKVLTLKKTALKQDSEPKKMKAYDGSSKKPSFKHGSHKKVQKKQGPVIGSQTRAIAAQIVSAVEQGRSLTEALLFFARDLEPRDNALCQEIVYGTLRHRRLLSYTLQGLIEHSIKERFHQVRGLLLCALYQLGFMRTPAHAVVAASVGACELCKVKQFTALVNAVLRRFLREGGHLRHCADEAVELSCADWMYQKLKEQYPQHYLEILKNNNQHAPMWLRVENSKISTANYLELLAKAQLKATPSPLLQSAIKLETPCNVNLLPGFEQGLCSVQDLAAQLTIPLLQLEDGLEVLDACAAPGGKSCQILDYARVQLTCADVDEQRLELCQQNLQRLKRQAQLQLIDLSVPNSKLNASFDRILVDAPCSGSGVIRRHPDIKWLRRHKDIDKLVQTQRQILDNAISMLRPGGILVYSTCSVFAEENQQQAMELLRRHPQLQPLPFKLAGREENYYMQSLPGDFEGDGFFYARFFYNSN